MICSKNFSYVLIILSLPFQFSFHLNFYTIGALNIQTDLDFEKIPKYQLDIANKITTYFAAISAIMWIFISYKIKKRRFPISIMYMISGCVWLIYLAISVDNFWLTLFLRAINGIILGFFQSVHISYIMHFAEEKLRGFHGCLVQVSMFLSLSFLNAMVYAISWRIICIILSIQSFIFGGLIWLVPEFIILPKSLTCEYIHRQPFLKYLLLMISIMVIQCFSGIGFMIDNCSRLLYAIGIDINSTVQSAFMNLIGCISSLICSLIIDVVGVRYMWAFSSFGIVISLAIYDITLKVECPKWLGVLSIFLYFLFFGLGEGPVPWLTCGVMFSESVMIESGGINTFMNRFMDIWFGYLLDALNKAFGEFGSVVFNASFSLVGCILGLFFIPNLKRSFHENSTIF
ncbi:glucose import [Tritrichomonas musculus]|uniref:Glucose import n=1 Tax=Tritrichomonas musculus TaxID=1915356 RepID=A0ABR2JXE8_9EUKA